jgi:MFS family permease
MIITRRKKIPLHWAFYAQLPLLLSIYGNFVINAPFLLLIKRYLDNPAAIMGLISIEVYVTLIGGPLVGWLSDRIWTRFGRRKFFIVGADVVSGFILIAMPFAPSLIWLIVLRWLYGAVRDLGQPTQALAYEVVPAQQRGRSAGFFSAMINFGNLIFFFLVLGRFDDVYFMGPLAFFGDATGGVLMFVLAAVLLVGVGVFEGLAIKEIEPFDRKTLDDGRQPGDGPLRHYFRAIFRDIFAKDLLPLYLLLVVNVMFGVGLGIFQPLLFTEQWGYSLQDMGNTVAAGVLIAVSLSLISGWVTDKVGKMNAFVIANAGSLVMNVFYTGFVYAQPDMRPTLLQIIVIGNLGLVFTMLKGVVTFPLMMEYVRRNRMGAAGAGMGLFNNLLRNTIALLVGVWLAWWSYWFLPQAGYFVEATMVDQLDAKRVAETLEAGGVELENVSLRPLHRYGVDGLTSMRWWIHRQDDRAHELLGEQKDLENDLARLDSRAASPFVGEAERATLDAEMAEVQGRLDAIDAELAAGTDALRREVEPALAAVRFVAGSQVRAATVADDRLRLSLKSIEPLSAEMATQIERLMQGPEHALVDGEDGLRLALTITADEDGFVAEMMIDPRFLRFYRAAVSSGVQPAAAYAAAASVTSITRGTLGREPTAFDLEDVQVEGNSVVMRLTTRTELPAEAVVASLDEDRFIDNATITGDRLAFDVDWANAAAEEEPWVDEVRDRLATLTGGGAAEVGLLTRAYERLVDAAAERPIYTTIPRNTLVAGHREREYEYFFASQTLMIATDLLGFAIVAFLLWLERRGVIERQGAEEDLAR